ncbi:ATP-dependent Clp protease proteolytic subunit [Pseudomonas helleri]|uniref:ATP-dependent Clp protease proteolytic subunit n=1 Tax=Pseudomonas helleri TaxID=1608996 RepID=A0A7X1XH14_9PSED|nr:ATP-dependent Clp protease proteolytic subunit [Pseudomonas helleri]MQT91410.1 hypothetical protein [Pseudomonas helleri]
MPHLSEKKDRESGGMDSLSSKLLDSTIAARKIFITGEINTKMAKDAVQQLHALAYMSDEPIIVFISSPGGHVESGDMIFDAIRLAVAGAECNTVIELKLEHHAA